MTDCQICYDAFNKRERLQVTCMYCTQSFCRTCVGQYLLSQQEQITCPNVECRMPWTEEFVDEHMYAVFRKGALAAHRQKFVLDREKARLPELQARARRYKIAVDGMEGRLKQKAEHLEQYNAVPVVARLKELEKEFIKKQNAYNDCALKHWQLFRSEWYNTADGRRTTRELPRDGVTQEQIDTFKAELEERTKERAEANKALAAYKEAASSLLEEAKQRYAAPAKVAATMPEFRQMVDSYGKVVRLYERDKKRIDSYRRLFGEDAVEIVAAGEQVTITPRQVVVLRGCPGEGCRGFLDEKWVCGVCDLSVCSHCHVGLADDEAVEERHGAGAVDEAPEGKRWHICNPDQIATARLLARDTKPCPKCKALISKIDGCDQMWCTQCQTAFSWETGQVEEGRVHNPHYYEWMRRNKGSVPREPAQPGDVPLAPGGDCCAQALTLQELPFEGGEQVSENTLFDNIFVDVLSAVPEGLPEEASVKAKKALKKLSAALLLTVYRKLVEVHEYYVLDRRNWTERYADQKSDEDAIDYLVGRLTEADWKRRVWLRDRARRHRNDCKEIKRMFYAAGRDILNSLVLGGGSVKVGETLKQISELMKYANDAMMKSKKRFCLSTDPDTLGIYHYVNYVERENFNNLYTTMGKEYKLDVTSGYSYNLNDFLKLVSI